MTDREEKVIGDLLGEMDRGKAHGAYNSAHEAYAVIAEELDELWGEVKKKRALRDPERLYQEALQVAATALRFAVELRADSGSLK